MLVIDTLVLLAVCGAGAWILGFAAQILDIFNSVLEIRDARDRELRSPGERRKIWESVWSIAGGAALVLVLGFGVDLAVRFFFDWNAPLWGGITLVALFLIAMLGALGIVAGMVRGEELSYAVLRSTLRDDEGLRLRSEQLAGFRTRLGLIDSRKRHIRFGLRDRAGLRPVRAKLAQVADEFAVVPPAGFSAMRPIRWKTAHAYLWRGNPVRLLPTLIAVLVFIDLLVAVTLGASRPASIIVFVVLALVAAAGSFLLALLEARLVLASKAAWHAVYQKQRIDVVRLLEELERSSRKGVAGLGDRVARALQILRDQQS